MTIQEKAIEQLERVSNHLAAIGEKEDYTEIAIQALELHPKNCHNENKDYDDCDQFVCSNCGIELQDWHQVERDEDDGNVSYHEYEFRFCPNCGARIESEE